MKKIIGIILSFLMLFSLMSCDDEPYVSPDKTPTSTWDGKTVTIDWYTSAEETATSYTLTSASDLVGLAQLVNGTAESVSGAVTFKDKTITLAVNVDLNGKEWTPIGNGTRSDSSYTGNAFKGTFKGNGLTISNLNITAGESSSACIGLFGIVDGGAIKNLVLKEVSINNTTCKNVGSVAGLMVSGSTMDSVTVESGTLCVLETGGMIGRMTISGTISNCTNKANITSTNGGTGGIVGKAYYSESGKKITIDNCINRGTITSSAGYVGGIAGLAAAEISSCKNYGAISGKATSIGGIVGEHTNYGYIKNSTNNGTVTNNATAEDSSLYGLGGIVGWIRYQNNSSDYGYSNPVTISGNTNNGKISGKYSVGAGGIVGMLYNTGTVSGNTNNAQSITGYKFVSGIVGGHQVSKDNLYGTDDTADTYVPQTKISDNTSNTSDSNINGDSCKSTIVYINDDRISSGVTGNTPENKNLQ